MKPLTMFISGVAVFVGLAGGTAAYTLSASPAPSPQEATVAASAPADPAVSPEPEEPKVRFKPCKAPTHREGKFCVQDIVNTVVLPAVGGSGPADNGSSAGHGDGPKRDKSRGSDDQTKDHANSDDRDHEQGDDDDDDEDEDHEDEDHGDDGGVGEPDDD